ncbi:scarecrow-like protein 14 isoform X2 [Rhodamnia argentea]|uniref:Scarecrow-like protein 14 isoform X2 n=1 Tax=Rhodamnia argentea TaxID=178133 RepID=A0ABM3HFK4_9MYRT|nr:scarecrow-like protein 14 isoform X2 [Rhodamnia argentea]
MVCRYAPMEGRVGGVCGSANALDCNLVNRLKIDDGDDGDDGQNFTGAMLSSSDLNLARVAPSLRVVSLEKEPVEDCDFSDVVLKYISEILMEEDVEEKTCMFQESAALQAAEKSFYEVIGEKYPPSLDSHLISCTDMNHDSPANLSTVNSGDQRNSYGYLVEPGWSRDLGEPRVSITSSVSSSYTSVSSPYSSNSTITDGFADSPVSILRLPEVLSEKESAFHFKKGVEEASKFLPDSSFLFADFEKNSLSFKIPEKDAMSTVPKVEKTMGNGHSDKSRGKKNPHSEDVWLEESRSHKHSSLSTESTVSSDMFDVVLLSCGKDDPLRQELQSVQQSGPTKGSNGKKGRVKKQGRKKDMVDLRTLLTLCAQSVAVDDNRSANEMLKQIRQHSSPTGDGMQRMAHYFANGLEARLAGSGTRIYTGLMSKPTSAASVLKAYHLYLAACPFRKISNFFSNKTIMNVADNATSLHIIDFGILYGFQWPCLIKRLSSRPGGPPKIRITGIDLPQPGFKPAERVEETGRRLKNYAKTFGVPFEFNAIAQRWDTIQLEDLRIDKDEVLVVNCMYRLRNLLDETVVTESPRDIVLNLMRRMNPAVFILGVMNGAYSAPFFISRFREALFHYSTIFDALETTVPRDIPERMLIEKEIFGWEAMNVIACEGSERIERPETYKQWQVRIMRAGFTPLPLNEEITEMAKDRVKSYYHKDFDIDEDGQWLPVGWKGRIVHALSTWVPSTKTYSPKA